MLRFLHGAARFPVPPAPPRRRRGRPSRAGRGPPGDALRLRGRGAGGRARGRSRRALRRMGEQLGRLHDLARGSRASSRTRTARRASRRGSRRSAGRRRRSGGPGGASLLEASSPARRRCRARRAGSSTATFHRQRALDWRPGELDPRLGDELHRPVRLRPRRRAVAVVLHRSLRAGARDGARRGLPCEAPVEPETVDALHAWAALRRAPLLAPRASTGSTAPSSAPTGSRGRTGAATAIGSPRCARWASGASAASARAARAWSWSWSWTWLLDLDLDLGLDIDLDLNLGLDARRSSTSTYTSTPLLQPGDDLPLRRRSSGAASGARPSRGAGRRRRWSSSPGSSRRRRSPRSRCRAARRSCGPSRRPGSLALAEVVGEALLEPARSRSSAGSGVPAAVEVVGRDEREDGRRRRAPRAPSVRADHLVDGAVVRVSRSPCRGCGGAAPRRRGR